MNKTAYDTLACRAYQTDGIKSGIELAMVEDEIISVETPSGDKLIKGLWGLSPNNDDVPAFTHPFRLEVKDGNPLYFLDTRPYQRVDREGRVSITNHSDYKFQILRGVLNLHWEDSPVDLINTGELAPLVFCRWLSEAIVKRLGMGPAEQARIMTVTLFYWHGLFREAEDEFSEKEKMRILTKLNRISSIPTTISMEIVDDIPLMSGVSEYVEVLRSVVGSPRMENLNPALLFAMLGGSWFGLNAKEIIAVATEHPPTFLAIILSALDGRGYRKSVLGRLAYENDKRGRGDDFEKNTYSIIHQHVGE